MFPWLPVLIQCKKDVGILNCTYTGKLYIIMSGRLNWKEIAISQDCNEEDYDDDNGVDDNDIFILPQGSEYT